MKVWWCQEHEASGGDERYCGDVDRYSTHCRMVPMRLIPDNAETVQLIGEVLRPYGHEAAALAVLKALDGETP